MHTTSREVEFTSFERIDGQLCRVTWRMTADGRGQLSERRAVRIETIR